MPLVSVILPTYNERENIAPLIGRLRQAAAWPLEALVVDDDSPDGTAAEVRRMAAGTDDLRLILREGDRGLTRSIQRGIDESAGTIIVWMDCDLSMPPELVPKLVAPLLVGEADAAVGSRYVDGGSSGSGSGDPPLVRMQKLLTRGMNRMAAKITGAAIRDWTSGFIAIRAPLIKGMRLEGEYGEYFIKLMAELTGRGARIVELPYRCIPRARGESKTARGLFGFMRLGLRYLRALAAARRYLRTVSR
jgi:dolichol-phosphate mannosyltransferase